MQLRAKFFIDLQGTVITKAKILNFKSRKAIFERDGYICQNCNDPVVIFRGSINIFRGPWLGHIDHIFPRSRGGQNMANNLLLLCGSCNCSKGAR